MSEKKAASRLLKAGDNVQLDGELMSVVAVINQDANGSDLVVESPKRGLRKVYVPSEQASVVLAASNDGTGDAQKGLTCLWGKWMEYITPRIRSAVLAVRPVRPYPHQDEAVFTHMLPQPRLRFLLADEPGTGKTIMAGMYLTEARRRGLVQGKTIIVVPAHLVPKWIRDLRRHLSINAMRLTAEMGREPQPLRPDIDVWVVSLDLFTYNEDVRRKIVGRHATWSLAIFDEAHRLTPTSQYLGAAKVLANASHHLLLLTATPHRGNEHFFRGLLNLLDEQLYPWDSHSHDYDNKRLQPGTLHFLRRMKEDLRDLDGTPLFRDRYATTRSVHLSPAEADAYGAVMAYVDEWYPEHSSLARSVYGKRAASALSSALETLQRRRDNLIRGQAAQPADVVPEGFTDRDFGGTVLDDDEAWDYAEQAVLQERSRNRRAELEALGTLISDLRSYISRAEPAAKWLQAQDILAAHGIVPSAPMNQLLVFTEFADTAKWLEMLFSQAGFTTETLDGSTDPAARDTLQQRFLNGVFQVMISTDAGGEGIDLQSANIMINWDIPWSLVRLEQRMGRLHRIGQFRDVFVYHLVAPATREGRVQEVMLNNLDAAGKALNGRIYDLLDATIGQLGFNYAQALVEAQKSATAGTAAAALVPQASDLITKARELARDEDRLKSSTSLAEARERLTADRLEAVNPVMVEGFLRQLAASDGWHIQSGSAPGILVITAPEKLPTELGGERMALVSADGAAVRSAYASGVNVVDVKVLGPTEEAFSSLVAYASHSYEEHLVRGVAVEDSSSLSDYTVFVWTCEIESHDGVQPERRPLALLVRYSGTEAFPLAWESLPRLVARVSPPTPPAPAARVASQSAAGQAVASEIERLTAEKLAWINKARADLNDIEARYKRQIASYPDAMRPYLRQEFVAQKSERLQRLDQIAFVRAGSLRLVGWLQVRGTATIGQMGWDPDSEKVAVATVMAELSADWTVDDRQTAGVGYDLFARHRRTGEVRLVEVKGLDGDLEPVTLEQHEWAQAQQRGDAFWLYVVAHCATAPAVLIRAQDPAGKFTDGTREIHRFRIPLAKLRQAMEAS